MKNDWALENKNENQMEKFDVIFIFCYFYYVLCTHKPPKILKEGRYPSTFLGAKAPLEVASVSK